MSSPVPEESVAAAGPAPAGADGGLAKRAARGRYRDVLRHRDLRLLIAAFLVDQTGSWSYIVVISVYIFDRTHSTQWLAANAACRWEPSLLLASLATGILLAHADVNAALVAVGVGIPVLGLAGLPMLLRADRTSAAATERLRPRVELLSEHDGQDPFGIDANPAPPTDFGAPGIDVRVPWLSGSTTVSTGNSYAAPHVTGLVARLLSKHPHLTPYEVKTVLRAVASNAVAPGADDEH